jgi:hypothetical protein
MKTRHLLACGIVAGPQFLAVWAIQAIVRDGFDPGRHPISLLSLGDSGWIQIANFVVTGALVVACAVGIRRALRDGRGRTWGPILVGGLGVGLIIAGVFVTDPGAGFPAGAPEGEPEQVSWHGILHGIGAVLGVNGMVVGCLVFARRYAAAGQRRWVAGCIATAVTVLVLSSPGAGGYAVRVLIATAILFGFVAALSATLRRDLDQWEEATPARRFAQVPARQAA